MVTYKMIELIGTSEASYEEAISNAVQEASRTIHDLAWFEVVEQRGSVKDGKVGEFQVKMNVAFKIVREGE